MHARFVISVVLALAVGGLPCAGGQQTSTDPVVWHFDNLTRIGGAAVSIVGHPFLVQTRLGPAVQFDGNNSTGDALFVDALPLSGTLPYTWEVIFRPASGGAQEQHFFHLQESGTKSRRLFELRIVDDKWCLVSFAANQPESQPHRTANLSNCDKDHLFPLDQWYAVAAVYDGKILRSYVNGVLQAETQVILGSLANGGTSVGARYTKSSYFKGDVFLAKFSKSVLPVDQLLTVPSQIPRRSK